MKLGFGFFLGGGGVQLNNELNLPLCYLRNLGSRFLENRYGFYFCTNQAPTLLVVCLRPAVEAIFIRFSPGLLGRELFLSITFGYILQSNWYVLKDLAFHPECNYLDIWKKLFSSLMRVTHGDSC